MGSLPRRALVKRAPRAKAEAIRTGRTNPSDPAKRGRSYVHDTSHQFFSKGLFSWIGQPTPIPSDPHTTDEGVIPESPDVLSKNV